MTINEVINQFKKEINYCKHFNQPFSSATQNLSERLLSIILEFKINSKKGYSFDNSLNDELKSCTYLQPKVCKSCGESVNYFAETCQCGSIKFDINKGDSRWGIDSRQHFEYFDDLNRYILSLVNYEEGMIVFNTWVINKNNEHFNYVLKNQMDSPKSDGVNFKPYDHDFFRSDPILIVSIKFNLDENDDNIFTNINLDNKEIFKLKKEHFNYNSRILNEEELIIIGNFNEKLSTKKMIDNFFIKNTDGIILSNYNINKRIKKLGKERGKTKR